MGDLGLSGPEGKRSLNDQLKVTKVIKVTKVVETTTILPACFQKKTHRRLNLAYMINLVNQF